jgi:hypothetical protein
MQRKLIERLLEPPGRADTEDVGEVGVAPAVAGRGAADELPGRLVADDPPGRLWPAPERAGCCGIGLSVQGINSPTIADGR